MKLILFDCDGTLVDSQAIQLETMQRTMADIGAEQPDTQSVRELIGVSLEETFAHLLRRPIDSFVHSTVRRFKVHYGDIIAEQPNHSPPYAGIQYMLDTLGQIDDVLLGIVTGKSRKGLSGLIDKLNWQDIFFITRTADDCPSKPHPAMVCECCEASGIDPAFTLVIGDTSFDMEMAKSAGAAAIGVEWGYHPAEVLFDCGAEQVISQPSEILNMI